ncbi:MAG: hypothetical protein HY904_10850 [Deltaproteobacteria bacterium]|nr:hypothetical protein [Deltaproteobacteria bacterium]
MSIDPTPVHDAARLIALALVPSNRPLANAEYGQLLARVRTDPAMEAALHEIAVGLGLRVLEVAEGGVILGTTADSPFAMKTADWKDGLSGDERVLTGLVHVGLAAYVYPRPEELERVDVKAVSVADLDGFLRDACRRLQELAAGETDPPAEHADLEHAWRVYLRWPAVGETAGGGRARKTMQALVRQTLEHLADLGMLRRQADETYQVLHRFRVQVRELAGHQALDQLRAVAC